MSTRTIQLAIELSSRAGEVGIARADGYLGTEVVRSESRHADDLIPAIDRLLVRQEIRRSDLDTVMVSVGPGGFTGLRIAVATTKMLAWTLRLRVVAVPTAMVVADAVEPRPGVLGVCLAAKRDQVWLARFRCHHHRSRWLPIGPGRLLPRQAVAVEPSLDLLVAEFVPDGLANVCREAGRPIGRVQPSARCCWRAGSRLAGAGAFVDDRSLLPIYARQPEAVRLWHRRETTAKRRAGSLPRRHPSPE